MKTIKNGRRQFLANMALLSAGIAVGGPVSFGFGKNFAADLESKWRALCIKLGGISFSGDIETDPAFYLNACSGHRHLLGKPVAFADGEIMAVPVWIYWQNSYSPADVVISFYNSDGSKLCTINRFEMEAIYSLDIDQGKERALLPLVRKNKINKSLEVTINNTGFGRDYVKTRGNLCGKEIQEIKLINI